jgi:polyhydroxyalkanoate synthesis regulator phasin
MKIKLAALTLAVAFGSGAALAQTTSTPRIDQRQENQDKRIDQGVKSGQLNQKEAARLEKGQARVDKMENKATADGKVTAKERRRIERAQDKQSKKIYREKHDKQVQK